MFSRILLSVFMLCVAIPSFAHQQKAGLTTVLFNQRSGQLEIAHRFYLHDAEHAIGHLFGKGADIYQNEKTQTRFAQYIQTRFGVAFVDGEELKPSYLGYEMEGKFMWVYQELALPKQAVDTMYLRQSALQELWREQINTVNVEARDSQGQRLGGKEKVRSSSFTRGEKWKALSLKGLFKP